MIKLISSRVDLVGSTNLTMVHVYFDCEMAMRYTSTRTLNYNARR